MTQEEQQFVCAPSLLRLPVELLISLLDFLDWSSLTSLRLTNSVFSAAYNDSILKRHRSICKASLLKSERDQLRQLERDYWEAAEESFQGYHTSSYTSSSLDPDLRAHAERYTCISRELPCYLCLQWLPSPTDERQFASESLFSRGRSTGAFNLGAKNAELRVCIPCGMRTGLYVRGNRIKHSVICYRCGTYTEALENRKWDWNDPRKGWQHRVYCPDCLREQEVKDQTARQYAHEKLWGKYETGMRAGKQYRNEKGRRLRDAIGEGEGSTSSHKPPRFCPVMREDRYCGCDGTRPSCQTSVSSGHFKFA